MQTNNISEKQNEPRMLRYQYAARSFYNRAEIQNFFVWIFVLISWALIFIPINEKNETPLLCIAFFSDLIAAFFCSRVLYTVNIASSLRKYFDAYVFGFDLNRFSELEVRGFEELIIKIINTHQKSSRIQMMNTGRDKPPGVLDWYEIPTHLSEQDAIFECQKQNCWWNKKITIKRIAFSGVLIISFFCITIGFFKITNTDLSVLKVALCSAGLVLKAGERIATNIRYYLLGLKIDHALETLEVSKNSKLLLHLQELIENRRTMPVLEINIVHRMLAEKLSVLYKRISTRSTE